MLHSRTIATRRWLALFSGLVAVGAFVACAESDSAAPKDVDPDARVAPESDGGSDGDVVDADTDAENDVDAGPRICSDDEFCHTAVPPKQTLLAVWSDGQGIAWAGTKTGEILRWDGKAWSVHATGLGRIASIWGASPTEIWAVGEGGIRQGTGATSETVTFTANELPGEGQIVLEAVWGSGPNDVWVVGSRVDGGMPSGRVYRFEGATTDAGTAQWMLDPASWEGDRFHRVWGSPGSGVWLVCTRTIDHVTKHHVIRRPVGAKGFQDVEFPPLIVPGFSKAFPANVYAAGMADNEVWLGAMTDQYQFAFYRGVSTDGGASFDWTIWPYSRDQYDSEYTALAMSPTEVWAAGGYGRLRTWDGKRFTQAAIAVKKNVPVTADFFGLWTSNGEVWAVGEGIALHRAKK